VTIHFGFIDAPDADQPHPSDSECPCPNPDDQYLMEIDAGSASLIHQACGKQARGDYTDLVEMPQIPVTVKAQPYGNCDGGAWHGEYRCDCGILLFVTVNGRTVVHDDVPYLVDRQYTDREGAVWHITELVDGQDRPLVFLLPEGAGEYVPLGEVVDDFGPLTLRPADA
jgi:hypothetical protein